MVVTPTKNKESNDLNYILEMRCKFVESASFREPVLQCYRHGQKIMEDAIEIKLKR